MANKISPLRRTRLARQLSLDELGLRAGIERSKLGRAERGYTSLSPDQLGRIARILQVEPKQIQPPNNGAA